MFTKRQEEGRFIWASVHDGKIAIIRSQLAMLLDKVIFAAYQTSGSAIITNYFSSGVAVFAFLGTSVIVPLAVILVFKLVGANILRVWLNFEERRNSTQGAQA